VNGRCVDEDVNIIADLINEYWHLRVRTDGSECHLDQNQRTRLAEMADQVASRLDAQTEFYRTRADYLRSGV
jgi:hypothetical protein